MKTVLKLFTLSALIIGSLPAHAEFPASFNPKKWTIGKEEKWNGTNLQVQDIKTRVADTNFGVESITEYTVYVPDAKRLATLKVSVSEDNIDEAETLTFHDSNSWGKTVGKILAASAIVGFWVYKAYMKSVK
ncbi:MAG: hypothetical protein BWY54_00421 [Candidatus Dependentiae bacterium ADurb.Bin331]|nr:MAG: hypothetical protein BWY54_00421 [Candidatus Dependentiae bacterium ADurb.Bin331]